MPTVSQRTAAARQFVAKRHGRPDDKRLEGPQVQQTNQNVESIPEVLAEAAEPEAPTEAAERRQAAMARMRLRRAERAQECARERDETLAELLDEPPLKTRSQPRAEVKRFPGSPKALSDRAEASDMVQTLPPTALPKFTGMQEDDPDADDFVLPPRPQMPAMPGMPSMGSTAPAKLGSSASSSPEHAPSASKEVSSPTAAYHRPLAPASPMTPRPPETPKSGKAAFSRPMRRPPVPSWASPGKPEKEPELAAQGKPEMESNEAHLPEQSLQNVEVKKPESRPKVDYLRRHLNKTEKTASMPAESGEVKPKPMPESHPKDTSAMQKAGESKPEGQTMPVGQISAKPRNAEWAGCTSVSEKRVEESEEVLAVKPAAEAREADLKELEEVLKVELKEETVKEEPMAEVVEDKPGVEVLKALADFAKQLLPEASLGGELDLKLKVEPEQEIEADAEVAPTEATAAEPKLEAAEVAPTEATAAEPKLEAAEVRKLRLVQTWEFVEGCGLVLQDEWREQTPSPVDERLEELPPVEKKPEKEKTERLQQVEEVEQVEKVEHVEKVEQIEKVEQAEQVEKVEQVETEAEENASWEVDGEVASRKREADMKAIAPDEGLSDGALAEEPAREKTLEMPEAQAGKQQETEQAKTQPCQDVEQQEQEANDEGVQCDPAEIAQMTHQELMEKFTLSLDPAQQELMREFARSLAEEDGATQQELMQEFTETFKQELAAAQQELPEEVKDEIATAVAQEMEEVAAQADPETILETLPEEPSLLEEPSLPDDEPLLPEEPSLPEGSSDSEDDEFTLAAAREAEEAARKAQEALEAARAAKEKAKEAKRQAKEAKAKAKDGKASVKEEGTEASLQEAAPVEVLLILDTSFAMHAPEAQAQKLQEDWNEDDWDRFGQHLRSRSERCRLEPLGLQALGLLASAARGLAVEVRLCGEDGAAGECQRHCPLDEDQLGRKWRRLMCRGADVWRHLGSDIERLKACGLRSAVVLTGTDVEASPELMRTVTTSTLPVHVLAVAPSESTRAAAKAVSSAASGSYVELGFGPDDSRSYSKVEVRQILSSVLQELRALPRPSLAASAPDPEALRCRAARILQRAVRRFLTRRRLERQTWAVQVIERTYGCHRWRRSLAEAADETRRARRRAPVEEALRRRAAQKRDVESEAAARRIQAEWRATGMRRWCRRIDRAARRIQSWQRRRKLSERVQAEAERLIIRRGQKVAKPPAAPSKWPSKLAPNSPEQGRAPSTAASTTSAVTSPTGSASSRPTSALPDEPPKTLGFAAGSAFYYTASVAPQRLPSPASAQAAGRSLPFFADSSMSAPNREERVKALAAAARIPPSSKKALHRTLYSNPARPNPRRSVDAQVQPC